MEVTAAPLNPVDLSMAAGTLLRGPAERALRARHRGRRAHRRTAGASGSRPARGTSATARWPSGPSCIRTRGRAARRRERRRRGLSRRRRASRPGCRWRIGRAVEAGETVLVLGATGVVGQIAVQAAKLLGAGQGDRGRPGRGEAREARAPTRPCSCPATADDLAKPPAAPIDVVLDPLWGEHAPPSPPRR